MKTVFLISILFAAYGCSSQKVNTNSQTVEVASIENKLNNNEVELLDSLLKDSDNKVDLTNKKAAFITGSSGSRILTKEEFFEICINPWTEKRQKPQVFILELNENEKIESGGYEVLVLAWVKVFTKRRKVIKLLADN